jgi:hypothetical protein
MVTIVDAKNAMKKVQTLWRAWIPSHLVKYEAEDIFIFCDSDKYKNYFSMIFELIFKKAGNYPQGPLDFFNRGICGIPAFASPHPHTRRMLYISPNTWVTEKILAHEYMHWLSHENFYPKFYQVGGANPFRVEGVTQWLTCEAGYDMNDRVYEHEWLKTDSWIRADKRNLDRMLTFMLQGVATNLDSIHP